MTTQRTTGRTKVLTLCITAKYKRREQTWGVRQEENRRVLIMHLVCYKLITRNLAGRAAHAPFRPVDRNIKDKDALEETSAAAVPLVRTGASLTALINYRALLVDRLA